MDFVLANRYLDRHDYYGMRRKVNGGKLRNCYFCENPIRPHVNFEPQNDPLREIQPKWLRGCKFMESLGLLCQIKRD